MKHSSLNTAEFDGLSLARAIHAPVVIVAPWPAKSVLGEFVSAPWKKNKVDFQRTFIFACSLRWMRGNESITRKKANPKMREAISRARSLSVRPAVHAQSVLRKFRQNSSKEPGLRPHGSQNSEADEMDPMSFSRSCPARSHSSGDREPLRFHFSARKFRARPAKRSKPRPGLRVRKARSVNTTADHATERPGMRLSSMEQRRCGRTPSTPRPEPVRVRGPAGAPSLSSERSDRPETRWK
jgi:hypothetical protein